MCRCSGPAPATPARPAAAPAAAADSGAAEAVAERESATLVRIERRPALAFAVHQLSSGAKPDPFNRVLAALRAGGRFVVCDVVVPAAPVPVPIPLEDGVDPPDTRAAQLAWLQEAGFSASVVYENGDLAVRRADRP